MLPHYEDSDNEEENKNENKDKDLFNLVSIDSRHKETGTIMIESELKLMLLRHWTLFDSLCNSNYIVSTLKLWKEPG